VLETNKTGNLAPDSLKPAKQEGKSVFLSTIHEYGYDLRQKMGTLLLKEKKADFQSLANIKAAYEAPFGKEAKAIFASDKHKELPAMEAIRNLYAHKGGKVDVKFKSKMAQHPVFSSFDVGSQLLIDGEIVSEFVRASVNCGMQLIAMVDQKLIEQREQEQAKLPQEDWSI